MRYLKGTLDYGLIYYKEKSNDDIDDLNAYCDADFGADINDRKSLSKFVIKFGDTIVE